MSHFLREGRGTLLLALPLMAGQVSQMLMVVVDTLMIGRLGTVDLAAATLAQTILHIPLMLGIGIAIAVSIKVSQARGAKTPERARIAVQHGFFLSLVLGALTFAISLAMLPLLPYLGQDPRVVDRVPTFFLLVSASMIPALASMAARSHADAMARPWPAFWIILGGVLLNVFLNWVLIGGKMGAPAMGLEGAGWATLIARIMTLVGVLMWLRNSPQLRNWIPEHWFRIPERKPLYDFWKIVWPSSLQVSAEISAFIAASFLIGTLGAEALAAHQVAITCVSTIFMVPLGLSMAVTVQIGEAFGATTHERARPIVLSAWAMGLTFSLIFVGVFFVFGETIARWGTT